MQLSPFLPTLPPSPTYSALRPPFLLGPLIQSVRLGYSGCVYTLDLTRGQTLRKPFYLRSCQLPVVPDCGGDLPGLHGPRACCDTCHEFTLATALLCQGQTISITPGSYSLPAPSSTMIPKPWEDGCLVCVPFGVEHSVVSYSLNFDSLWVSVLTATSRRQKLLR